jgi:HAD superfamily hydrolase (TIGR01509 family)
MAPRAIIFDLDGTIWDSEPWFARLLGAQGGPGASEYERLLRSGTSIVKLIARRAAFVRIATASISSLNLYPEIRKVLALLSEKNVGLGVFTSLPGWIVEPILSGLGIDSHFRAVIHAGNCRQRKPHPMGIFNALGALGVQVGPTVYYVGDREVDSRTARNAGISFAWASYGYGRTAPQFVTAKIDEPKQILTI